MTFFLIRKILQAERAFMNINHLRYFYDACRLQSLSLAAEGHFVGQSAISKAIQRLEEDLGVPLIHHQRNRFSLTQQGIILFEQCPSLFQKIDQVRENVVTGPDQVSGDLRISCPNSMAEAFLVEFLKPLGEAYPKIQPHLHTGRTDIVRQWVQDEVVDVGLILTYDHLNDFNVLPVWSGYFYLVQHPDDRRKWQSDGLYLTEETREIRELRKLYRKKQGKALPSKMKISSFGLIKRFVLEGHGVGLLPDYIVQNELQQGQLKIVSKSWVKIPYQIIFVTKKGRTLRPKEQKFYETLTDWYQQRVTKC